MVHKYDSMRNKLESCKSLIIDEQKREKIISCSNSDEGNNLLYEAAKETNNLKPTLTWVPWIIVDGYHSQKLQDYAEKNLLDFIECYKSKVRKFSIAI
jgi:interferon gamma-inducible protein 30